jgi:hypothetical protein
MFHSSAQLCGNEAKSHQDGENKEGASNGIPAMQSSNPAL